MSYVKQRFKKSLYSYKEIFKKHSKANRAYVRTFLIKNKQIDYKCNTCFNKGFWLKRKLSLHLDHINGVRNDNRLENLRFLCPNCHSQTDTYCGKNIPKNIVSDKDIIKASKHSKNINEIVLKLNISQGTNNLRVKKVLEKYNIHLPIVSKYKSIFKCLYCGCNTINKMYCSKVCTDLGSRKVIRPSKEKLKRLVWRTPTTQLSKILGVSGSAISKWCKRYKIIKPSRGYWQKINKFF